MLLLLQKLLGLEPGVRKFIDELKDEVDRLGTIQPIQIINAIINLMAEVRGSRVSLMT